MTQTKSKPKKWTESEVEFLMLNYSRLNATECAERLNRTVGSVMQKAYEIGAKRQGVGRKPRLLIKDDYLWLSFVGGQEAVHRMVYELYHDIKLTDVDIVHHINGIRWDNRIENLILTNRSEHQSEHHDRERNELGQYI